MDARAGWLRWLRRAGGAITPEQDLGIDTRDARELADTAVRVAGEFPIWAPELVVGSLKQLIRRRVPLRAVRPRGGTPGIGDLCFADGMVVIARASSPGDLARTAVALLTIGVALESFAVDEGRVTVVIVAAERRLRMSALGVLQPPGYGASKSDLR